MKCSFWIVCTVFILNISSSSMAQNFVAPGEKKEPGWLLKGGIGLMSYRTTGQVDDKIDSYDEDPQLEEKVLPWPTLQLIYNDIDESGNWLFGTKRAGLVIERRQITALGVFGLEMGVNLFSLLKLDILGKDFKNPYLLGETREKTGKSQTSQSLSYSLGKGVGFTLRMQRDEFKLEDDETPEVDEDLGRNGYKETFSANIRLWLLGLGQDTFSAITKGEADSYKGVRQNGVLRIPLFVKGLLAMIRVAREEAEYQKIHPIFNKVREDSTESNTFMLIYKTDERMIQCMTTQTRKDSNIDFFDTSISLVSLGATWEF